MGREDREALVRGRRAVIVNIAAFRDSLDVVEVVAVELMEMDFRRDVIKLSANQIVDADHLMTVGKHSVGQMASKKSGDTCYKYFHPDPSPLLHHREQAFVVAVKQSSPPAF
jgi:hypothetical protein